MTSEDPVASFIVHEWDKFQEAFFFDLSLDMLSIIGLDGYFKRVNSAFTQTLGYSEAEFLSRPFLEFVHPDDRAATLAETEKLNRGIPTLAFENRYQTKDDSYRWLAWTASPQIERGVWYCVARDITQQKQTEAALEQRVAERTAQLEQVNIALRESEERTQLAMEVAQMYTFEWEPGTDVVKRSRHCGSILGLTEDAIEQDTGANYFQRIHFEDRDRFTTLLKTLTPENSTYKTTYRVIRPDGQVVVLEESGRALFNSQEQLTRLIGMTVNVTERQRLTAELEKSRAMLQRQLAEIETIYRSAPIGLNVLDPDLRFVRINQRLADMNGFSVEEHIGRSIRELLPDIANIAEALLCPILETGEPLLNVEIRGKTPAKLGVERVWLESFLPLKEGDRVIGINTVCEEVTERIQVEAALRQSEERLRMAITSAQLGTWDWNLVTNELRWDAACKAMFGLPPTAESNIDLFFEGLHPDDRDRLQKIVQIALDPISGGSYDTEYRTIGLQDKVERWLRAKGQAYYDTNGKALRFSGTVLDITLQKQAEAQREQLFHQEQAAREAAECANRMKDEFLAVLSHELRTPLNPIMGWAKILQAPHVKPEKLQQGLSTIERNAKHQVQLIDDLLDISRIIRGNLTLNFAAVDLSVPITAALETTRLAAEAKGIQIEVFLNPTVRQVRGDASRLQQVIWNLLTNAIKFTPPGGRVEVKLATDRATDETDRTVNSSASSVSKSVAQITVTDTGKGIQSDFLPHVFELFRQQDSSTTRSFSGLGLGLAIARQVIEAHGGTITAASAGEGQGATFIIQLPLMPVPGSQAPDNSPSQVLNLENLQVVAVDDEVDSLELVKVLLEQEGAQVKAITSANAALRVLVQGQFDLLISDIGMPEMDGYAFIRQVRALPSQFNRDIPAIALTAYVGEANRRHILAAGFQTHLEKPIEPQCLLDAIAPFVTT